MAEIRGLNTDCYLNQVPGIDHSLGRLLVTGLGPMSVAGGGEEIDCFVSVMYRLLHLLAKNYRLRSYSMELKAVAIEWHLTKEGYDEARLVHVDRLRSQLVHHWA